MDETKIPRPAQKQYEILKPFTKQYSALQDALAPYTALAESLQRYQSFANAIGTNVNATKLIGIADSLSSPLVKAMEKYSDLASLGTSVSALQRIIVVVSQIEKNIGFGTFESLSGAEKAIEELASSISQITYENEGVYFPESLMPEDRIASEEPITVKRETKYPAECPKKKKVSLRDAYDIIYGLIMMLLTIVSILQSKMDTPQDQGQESIIETQYEIVETLQQQLDATLRIVNDLSKILMEIQPNEVEFQEDSQQSLECPAGDDSDSQSIDSNHSESQSEIPKSLHVSDVLDMN